MRIIAAIIVTFLMIFPAILGFLTGIGVNLYWDLFVFAIFFFSCKHRKYFWIICIVSAIALSLPPMPFWLSITGQRPEFVISLDVLEGSIILIVLSILINTIGLFVLERLIYRQG